MPGGGAAHPGTRLGALSWPLVAFKHPVTAVHQAGLIPGTAAMFQLGTGMPCDMHCHREVPATPQRWLHVSAG